MKTKKFLVEIIAFKYEVDELETPLIVVVVVETDEIVIFDEP